MRILPKRHRAALVALAFVATGIGGYSAASATGGDHNPVDVSPNSGQVRSRSLDRAALTGGQSETYTGITPCRVVDTRNVGGPIADTTRSFKASGDLTTQGGAANCGIPDNASSIAINVTGISTGGTGFMRAGAFGSGAAGATVLNFAPALNATNQVNIPLCRRPTTGTNPCTGGNAFTVRSFGTANLVADAVGYYTPPIFAYVAETGALGQSSGILAVTRTSGAPMGRYDITFDRNVSDCAASATDVLFDTTLDVSIELGDVANNKGQVAVTRPNDTYADTYFYVTVTC